MEDDSRRTTNEKFRKRFSLRSQDSHAHLISRGSPASNAINVVIICSYITKYLFPVVFIFAATCLNVNNCTSPIHGVCKTTDICQCNPGYIGNNYFILV